MDARGTPQGIRRGHLPDEGGDLGVDAVGGLRWAGPESWVQYSRKRRRCQPAQTLASPTRRADPSYEA